MAPQLLTDCGLHPCIAWCSEDTALAQLAHMVSKSCVGGTCLVTSEDFFLYIFIKYFFSNDWLLICAFSCQ